MENDAMKTSFADALKGNVAVKEAVKGLIARWQSKIRQKVLRETDKRVALMSEILNSIRLIKIYAWEKPFAKKIAGIRNLEMMRLRCSGLLSSVTNTLAPSIGICATIVTLLCLTMYGNSITSADAFTLMSMFNMIGFTVSLLPYVVRCFAEAHISLKRIQKLLDMCEHHQTSASKDCAVFSVQIQDADYAWEVSEISYKDEKRTDDPKRTLNTMNSSKNKSKSFASNSPKQVRTLKLSASCNGISEFATDSTQKRDLSSGSSESATDENKTEATPNGISEFTVVNNKTRDTSGISESATDNGQRESSSDSVQTLSRISLTIPHGKLIGICGSIGSGKSSLISAICGDMRLERGKMYVNGKAALVTQQAWIYSGTLRENVLLGSDYLEERYLEALRLSCLDSDLELLPAGDLTEIGERGINLSGGQKQRVNLARAVYSDRDLYLLDDPLSAVDTKVGNAIFHDCIQGHLRNKTVLLVTHAIHLLEQCDEVIVMQDGGIVEQGSHNELLQQRGAYYAMIKGNGDNMGDKEKEGKKQKQTSTDGHKKEGQTKDQDAKEEAGKLTTEETKETGSVGSRVYFIFIKVFFPTSAKKLLNSSALALTSTSSGVWRLVYSQLPSCFSDSLRPDAHFQ
ncbi:Multidrug resistance-associated protein 5 [Halocaridina rubra]|uniref:Multidrug resistance-associated protein 5 n=1 Tax=Halocaridina rubra TaxID=373956 RepID=A0AAN8WZM5_HALRR